MLSVLKILYHLWLNLKEIWKDTDELNSEKSKMLAYDRNSNTRSSAFSTPASLQFLSALLDFVGGCTASHTAAAI